MLISLSHKRMSFPQAIYKNECGLLSDFIFLNTLFSQEFMWQFQSSYWPSEKEKETLQVINLLNKSSVGILLHQLYPAYRHDVSR